MKNLNFPAILFAFSLTACSNMGPSINGAGGSGGSGSGGANKSTNPPTHSTASNFNIADFPNVPNKVFGMWQSMQASRDAHGGNTNTRIFFGKGKTGISVECTSGRYDVSSNLAVPATIQEPNRISIIGGGVHVEKSSDGLFPCAASLQNESLTYTVTGNTLITTDGQGTKRQYMRVQVY